MATRLLYDAQLGGGLLIADADTAAGTSSKIGDPEQLLNGRADPCASEITDSKPVRGTGLVRPQRF